MGIIGLALAVVILRSNPGPDQTLMLKNHTKNPEYSYARPSQRIKGFKYDGYDGSNRLVSIKSRSLIISRKKLGFIRFALINVGMWSKVETVLPSLTLGISLPKQH